MYLVTVIILDRNILWKLRRMWKRACLLTLFVFLSVSPGLPLDEDDNQAPGHYLNSFLVKVDSHETAERVARDNGFELLEKLPELDFFVLQHAEVSGRSKRGAEDYVRKLQLDDRVIFAEQQITLRRDKRNNLVLHDKQLEFPITEITDNSKYIRPAKKFDTRGGHGPIFNDEYFTDQWYLVNTDQNVGERGMDINVLPAWENGYNGEGVVVTVLDDGIDHMHPDIRQNYDPDASADMNDGLDKLNDPAPDKTRRGNSHGTRCAGEIAAVANNGICGVGVAPRANIGGIRILDGPITDELEARALLYNKNHIDILSASWGPRDDGKTLEAPKRACIDALRAGVTTGRNGKGSIYVWASGNGGESGDMCGADGYLSSVESISVQSLTDKGEIPFFGEKCCSTMISVPTGGEATQEEELVADNKIKVVTIDIDGGCIENFEGTSSAAPIASGCYALVLQANPNLTWRDIQHITAQAARIPYIDEAWIINGAGYHVNSNYGFGIMDCSKMVELAQSWKTVPEHHICETEVNIVNRPIGSGSCIRVHVSFDGCKDDRSHSVNSLEHVQLVVKLSSGRRGNVEIMLQSPAGTRSDLLTRRPPDDSSDNIDFTFMTIKNWGENPEGEWTVEVCDNPGEEQRGRNTIHLDSYVLRTYGYHDNENKPPKRSQIPTAEHLEHLKDEEFIQSRKFNLKRAQGSEQREDMNSRDMDQYVQAADELIAGFADLFNTRTSVNNDYKNNAHLKTRNYGYSKVKNQFGKRVQSEEGAASEDSDISEIKREIIEILAKLDGKNLKKNYIEVYLQHKKELERKKKMEELIREIDDILNSKK